MDDVREERSTAHPAKGPGQLSPLKRAYLALEKAQARLESLERARHEAVAVVGMACRFPGGVNSPEDYWKLLTEGRDAVVEVPASRWDIDALFDPDPNAPGKVCSRFGGFIDNMDQFDAAFFGIAPREAESLDPQQRLLLEVAQEALEDGGAAGERLAGSPTGVFVGLANGDYYCLLTGNCRERIDAYMGTGTSPNSAAGRVSYVFGLRGPCVAIDTACSSSLVAIHLACQGLRNGECDMALAGGVNVMLTPDLSITFSKAHMLCRDGRCKTFDAAANGYVRGEGIGLILLKRLSDAVAQGDRILAVIRGSAVNHAGDSGGLTVPNGPAQQQVIRRALAQARLRPEDISYIEAHGTGTSLGDPIEVGALGGVFGGRSEPLWMGSVKTNLGHLEAAAGIAGLMKVVLALRHGEIPPHLHFKTPSPKIPWDSMPLRVPTRREPWTAGGRRRAAGVSSFGFSGINAHIVVEEAPAPPQASKTERDCYLLPLSAKHPDALRQLASRYARQMAGAPGLRLADVCYTASTGRAHFEHRLALVARTTAEAAECLERFAAGEPCDRIHVGHSGPEACKVAFLLAGNDSPGGGLARQLYERAQLWESWGIRPAVLVGQGVGEYVAACLAGVFSLDDALKLTASGDDPASAVTYARPRRKLIAPATGEVADKSIARAEYWRDAKRPMIQLPQCEATLAAEGVDALLEIGPSSPLFEGRGKGVRSLFCAAPSGPFREKAPDPFSTFAHEWASWLENLAELYVAGAAVDWHAFLRPVAGRNVSLPTYPFQRRRYWVQAVEEPSVDSSAAEIVHPLLGRRVFLAGAADLVQFEGRLSGRKPAFLEQHRLAGVAIMPASGFFEVPLAAAREVQPGRALVVENVVLEQAMPFSEGLPRIVQTAVKPDGAGFRLELYSRPARYAGAATQLPWTLHAGARLVPPPDGEPTIRPDFEEVQRRCGEEVPLSGFYAQLGGRGLEYGPLFQGLKRLWRGDREALGQVELEPDAVREAEDYLLYPPLVDACLHVTAELLDPRVDNGPDTPITYVPVGVEKLHLFAPPGPLLWSHARLREGESLGRAPRYQIDVDLLAADGTLAARLEGLQVQQIDLEALAREFAQRRDEPHGEAGGAAGILAEEISRLPADLQRQRVAQFLEDLIIRTLKLTRGERPEHDRNLFELGLDSLMSVELLYRINEAMQINLSMESLLQGAAIAPLAEAIVRELAARGPAPAVIDAGPDARALPSPVQPAAAFGAPTVQKGAAGLRLLCCAPPEAEPSVFEGWSETLKPDVEVCPIGRPEADAVPPHRQTGDWTPLVESVAEEALDLLDRPFALFGFGSGARLALDVAQTIHKRFGLAPVHVTVAASGPPGTAASPLDCPLTAVACTQPEPFDRDAQLAWQRHTSGSFRLELLKGDLASHLQSPERLLRIVRRDLQDVDR